MEDDVIIEHFDSQPDTDSVLFGWCESHKSDSESGVNNSNDPNQRPAKRK